MKSRAIADLIASLLVLLFAYAAISQLINRTAFYLQLQESLGKNLLSALLSWALPMMQLVICVLLVRPLSRLAGLCSALAVISIFTVYLVMMLPKSGRSICHCGEPGKWVTLEINILFNVAVILLTGIAIIVSGKYRSNTATLSEQ